MKTERQLKQALEREPAFDSLSGLPVSVSKCVTQA